MGLFFLLFGGVVGFAIGAYHVINTFKIELKEPFKPWTWKLDAAAQETATEIIEQAGKSE